MNLDTLRTLYFSPLKDVDPSKGDDKKEADRNINTAYKEVYRAHRWEARKKTGQLTLIPNYTTGTCSVTKFDGTNEGSAKTVTFFGATLSSAMLGRFLKVSGSSYWHKIVYIDSSTVYLDTPIVDVNTGGGLSFIIWKRFYYLKSDVEELIDFGRHGDGRLAYSSDFLDKITDLSQTGTPPTRFDVYGVDPYSDTTYTTGAVTVEANSNVAVGVSTAWLSSGYDTGDIMQINNVNHYVKRIESDTRIILQNYVEEAIASTTYELRKNKPYGVQFFNPSDTYIILPYEYLDRPYDLVHPTKDFIGLSDRFISAIISRAQFFAYEDATDVRAVNKLQVYGAELEGLKQKVNVVKSRFTQFAPRIPARMPGRC